MMITAEKDVFGGAYYIVRTDASTARFELAVERPDDLERFVASYLDEPFFMTAKAGSRAGEIPKETQFLGIKHRDGSFSVYFAMAFETFRTSLYGKGDEICVLALTGDEEVKRDAFCAYYKISGDDFYELVASAARSLRAKYGTFRRRDEKPEPDFLNLFGWCTWDSFYETVSAENVMGGLESFRNGGLVPKLLILDDGWQSTAHHELDRGQWKLSSFVPNEKFGNDLTEITVAARRMGVEKFLVWHAILGYWGGADPDAEEMRKYRPVLSKAVHTEALREMNLARWENEHFAFGLIAPEMAGEFYGDYHACLAEQGVDGVKVDVQASLGAHGQGRGGRIAMTRRFHEALESSVREHFDGEMINCMSLTNDIIYHLKDTGIIRTSGDFTPADPASHGRHIYINAVNSLWLREFGWCDWDMFQTKHPFGAYHAAARAVSGGPVYVSDRVGEHDFELINALTDGNGRLFRTKTAAVPTPDCLFRDPAAEGEPYKIFSLNELNAVAGVFSFGRGERSVTVSPRDAFAHPHGRYALYSYRTKMVCAVDADGSIPVTVGEGGFDIVTIAPIKSDLAVIGLKDKLNGGGAVSCLRQQEDGFALQVADRGTLLLWTERALTGAAAGGKAAEFTYAEKIAAIQIPEAGEVNITVRGAL